MLELLTEEERKSIIKPFMEYMLITGPNVFTGTFYEHDLHFMNLMMPDDVMKQIFQVREESESSQRDEIRRIIEASYSKIYEQAEHNIDELLPASCLIISRRYEKSVLDKGYRSFLDWYKETPAWYKEVKGHDSL